MIADLTDKLAIEASPVFGGLSEHSPLHSRSRIGMSDLEYAQMMSYLEKDDHKVLASHLDSFIAAKGWAETNSLPVKVNNESTASFTHRHLNRTCVRRYGCLTA